MLFVNHVIYYTAATVEWTEQITDIYSTVVAKQHNASLQFMLFIIVISLIIHVLLQSFERHKQTVYTVYWSSRNATIKKKKKI